MKIILCKEKSIEDEGLRRDYSYRIVEVEGKKGAIKNKMFYGIEVERRDFINGELVNIERDGEKLISSDCEKVKSLFNKAYTYLISPIHFIDIFSNEIDELRFNL
ncbi:DUF6514 family protein [Oceanirhabdus sp. W0125-5]|uniref:DUF6514 family protein n=1 Tax=Oceanirhabdus sp. W0125-5 TaxID=2999116 RepID=UPI0022F2D259|nr:DUF6514 family protein [Oceanirhabdus sp. W0125-5]WBW99273.1 DUF6514 family protein [Oceanirhabdus sp. W0125-5]